MRILGGSEDRSLRFIWFHIHMMMSGGWKQLMIITTVETCLLNLQVFSTPSTQSWMSWAGTRLTNSLLLRWPSFTAGGIRPLRTRKHKWRNWFKTDRFSSLMEAGACPTRPLSTIKTWSIRWPSGTDGCSRPLVLSRASPGTSTLLDINQLLRRCSARWGCKPSSSPGSTTKTKATDCLRNRCRWYGVHPSTTGTCQRTSSHTLITTTTALPQGFASIFDV